MILGERWRAQGAGKKLACENIRFSSVKSEEKRMFSQARKKQKLVSISSQYWERIFHNQGILDIRTYRDFLIDAFLFL